MRYGYEMKFKFELIDNMYYSFSLFNRVIYMNVYKQIIFSHCIIDQSRY